MTFLMLNPSLADIEHSDPTVKRCEAFSQTWGFAGIEVVNVFGSISPYPEDLRGRRNPIEHRKGVNDLGFDIGAHNANGYGSGPPSSGPTKEPHQAEGE